MYTQENDRVLDVGQPMKSYQIQPSKERKEKKRKKNERRSKCAQETTTAVDELSICA
jgi:hypothetical protein